VEVDNRLFAALANMRPDSRSFEVEIGKYELLGKCCMEESLEV